MGNNTGYIYTLIDPRTNLVRYVGQTINEPYKRLAQHNCNYKRKIGKIRHSDAWIKNLHKNNLRPIMEVIDECSIDELNNKEIEYIKLYKSIGAKLCNHSTGGESGRGCKMSEESILNENDSNYLGNLTWQRYSTGEFGASKNEVSSKNTSFIASSNFGASSSDLITIQVSCYNDVIYFATYVSGILKDGINQMFVTIEYYGA